jgi:hypothetical protein
MLSQLSSFTRSGMVALIALAVLPMEAPAASIGPVMPAVADGNSMKPIQVQGEGRDDSASPAYQLKKRKYQQQPSVQRDRAMQNTRPKNKKRRHNPDEPSYRGPGYDGPAIILQF